MYYKYVKKSPNSINRDWILDLVSKSRCWYCGRELHRSSGARDTSPLSMTADHIVPYSKNKVMPYTRKSFEKNCVVACNECNILRGTTDFVEWGMAFIVARIDRSRRIPLLEHHRASVNR